MKLSSKKGFTLMEMLIVVGIIAVLVAVSIPVFTNQIEKAREAADVANMRSAKSVAVATYLTNNDGQPINKWYDATNGVLTSTAPAGYGKGTTEDGKTASYSNYSNTTAYTNQKIWVDVDASGNVKLTWKAS